MAVQAFPAMTSALNIMTLQIQLLHCVNRSTRNKVQLLHCTALLTILGHHCTAVSDTYFSQPMGDCLFAALLALAARYRLEKHTITSFALLRQ